MAVEDVDVTFTHECLICLFEANGSHSSKNFVLGRNSIQSVSNTTKLILLEFTSYKMYVGLSVFRLYFLSTKESPLMRPICYCKGCC